MQFFKENKKEILSWVLFFILSASVFYLMESYEHNAFVEVRTMAQFFNIILFEFLACIFLCMTGSKKWALRILFIFSMVFGLVNHYVMEFRSTPFVPWDIFSIRTATSVVGGYHFTFGSRVIIVTLIFIFLFIIVRWMPEQEKQRSFEEEKIDKKVEIHKETAKRWGIRAICGVILVGSLCGFVTALQNEDFQRKNYLYPFLFTPAHMTKVNGMAVMFSMNLKYIAVDKPDGYRAEEAKELLDSYETSLTKEELEALELPNIIVVMDEAFSDLSVLGDFSVSEDPMPFVHSLMEGKENTVSGSAQVSVCGGNTANSEFEFLTGNTMAFLPNGSIPYQQYIKEEKPSMASYLKELGYETYGQHPYNASGWCRDTVYPMLGFSELSFNTDYINPTRIRGYISDESSFDKIIETFENKKEDQPAFIFNVTMQNHGGYTDEHPGFVSDVVATDFQNDALNQYLSLINITDTEFEKLISYFEEVDEKTVVVFFGDHQPSDSVVQPIMAENGKDVYNLSREDTVLRYQVPYVIWANYDIEEATDVETSLNYLGAQVLSIAGVPLSPYQNFLLEQSKEKPVVSVMTVPEGLEEYEKLQYYQLFE